MTELGHGVLLRSCVSLARPRVISKRRISGASEIPAEQARQVLADPASASSRVNRPKRSNSGSIAPVRQRKIRGADERLRVGQRRGRPGEQGQILAAQVGKTPSGRSSPPGAARPVSSSSSRHAAAAKVSPGSATPFGMSQRGERVAWPSSRRSPSVTMTPQLVASPPHRSRHRRPPKRRRRSRRSGRCRSELCRCAQPAAASRQAQARTSAAAAPQPAPSEFGDSSRRLASLQRRLGAESADMHQSALCRACGRAPHAESYGRCMEPPHRAGRARLRVTQRQANDALPSPCAFACIALSCCRRPADDDAAMRCYRPLIIGRRGAVAANHPLAAQAGLMALRAGGNAVDAAVATALALAVVEPMMSGLGGDAFYHVFDAETGRAVVFNATGPAPRAATPERYAGGIPRTGPISVSVPGMIAGLGMMHRGIRPPALARSVRRGDPLRPRRLLARPRTIGISPANISRPCAPTGAAPRFFCAMARRRAVGAPIVQPDLARTLEEIAGEGADCLYRGALARRLAAACAACRRAGRAKPTSPNSRPKAGAAGDRLSRLHRARGAAQFDRFVAAPGAEDRREFRPRRRWGSARPIWCMSWSRPKSSPSPTASAGAPTRARSTPPFDELLSAEYCARLAARIDMRRAAPTRAHRRRRRRHDLFLHRRRRRQRGLRHPEHQQRLGLGGDRRRHRHPAQQPHGLLASRPRPSEPPAPGPPRAPHDEPAAGAEGRRVVGGVRHARRRQPGADQFPDR